MFDEVVALSMHEHVDGMGAILINERRRTRESAPERYAIHYSHHSGNPELCVPVNGFMRFTHMHKGYGAHALQLTAHVGKNDPKLDPICEAIVSKGWNVNKIVGDIPGRMIKNFAFSYSPTPKKSAWDYSFERYFIVDDPSRPAEAWFKANWMMHVHLADHGHWNLVIKIPEIYRCPDDLCSLIHALATIPHIDSIGNVHPANRYRPPQDQDDQASNTAQ